MYNIITISRQFGSGGRTIGREVAQRLGIPCCAKSRITRFSANQMRSALEMPSLPRPRNE